MTLITSLLILGFLCWVLFKKSVYHWTLSALFSYVLIYAGIVSFNYDHHPAIVFTGGKWDTFSMLGAAHVVGFMLLMRLLLLYARPAKLWNYCTPILVHVLTFDAVYLLCGNPGIMTGVTFDTAVMAMFFPLLLNGNTGSKQYGYFLAFIWSICILKLGGSTAYFILIAQGAWYGISRKNAYFIAISLFLIAVGSYTQGTAFLKSDGRIVMWAAYLDYFLEHTSIWIGAGPNSFEWVGPLIPLPEKYQYYWVHNDWIQFMFEYGIIGFALLAAAYVRHIVFMRKEPLDQAFWVGVGVCMFFYSPLHLLPIALYLGLIIAKEYDNA